ncbi:hypothetical protein PUN28_005823 [Cardiocondyla obscurior]|uniref:LAGLIDADG homing endonuclease n=1 Tax=Cardiocondyla obscurior TaxID=286306 RepID=A0AAW2G7X2_9HYME
MKRHQLDSAPLIPTSIKPCAQRSSTVDYPLSYPSSLTAVMDHRLDATAWITIFLLGASRDQSADKDSRLLLAERGFQFTPTCQFRRFGLRGFEKFPLVDSVPRDSIESRQADLGKRHAL